MASFDLVIPGWRPARANELLGNRFKAGRLKKRDRLIVGYYARVMNVPRAIGPRRISLSLLIQGHQKEADQDAYWKSTLDACVKAGLLIDDKTEWVVLGEVTYGRGPTQTTITLEDLP